MTRFERVYVSHNRLEWWYGHLRTALAGNVKIVDCPMARFNQPGHAVDADLRSLVDSGDATRAFYLGSADQMFRGLADLPLASAVWTDYLVSMNARLLPSLRLFDVVFSTQKDSVAALARAGIRHVEWLPFAFDTTLRSDPSLEKIYDVGFVGNLELPATRAERVAILTRLEQRYRMNDYRKPVFGDDMMAVYNQSRIVVNIPVPGGFNMRTFEAMASGALLLTKAVGNGQADLFRENTHLVTYRGVDDLVDKIDYYLRNDKERDDIAAAGRREVLARHTYGHRAARLLEVMEHAQHTRASDGRARAAAYANFYDYIGRPDLLASVAWGRGVAPLTRLRLMTRAAVKWGRSLTDSGRHGLAKA